MRQEQQNCMKDRTLLRTQTIASGSILAFTARKELEYKEIAGVSGVEILGRM